MSFIQRLAVAVTAASLAAGMAVVTTECAPSPTTPTIDPRAVARASVLTAEDVWDTVANGCVAVAQAKQDDSVRQKCATVMIPVHDTILVAAEAVDSWTAADQGNFACLMRRVVDGLGAINVLVTDMGGTSPVALQDAVALANQFAPSCPSSTTLDASSEQ